MENQKTQEYKLTDKERTIIKQAVEFGGMFVHENTAIELDESRKGWVYIKVVPKDMNGNKKQEKAYRIARASTKHPKYTDEFDIVSELLGNLIRRELYNKV